MRLSARPLTLALLAALLPWAVAGETAHAGVRIQEWTVPWADTRPRDPDVAPDGSIWFVGQRGGYLARLDPDSGDFRRIELASGAGPHNLVVADADTLYYAGNRSANIGRVDMDTGEIELIPMPDRAARDPHTLVFDAEDDIWFTVQGGNRIGHLDTDTDAVRLLRVPTPRARPYGIKVARDGTVWATLFGTSKLARIDPETMTLTEVPLPEDDARPRRLGITSDGAIWYVDYARGMLGRHDPATGTFREWPTPSGAGSRPYGMAVDDQDRVWFVETGVEPNRFVGFDARERTWLGSTTVPSGGGTVRHMVFDPQRNAIWFGADTNTVGRALLPE